jgi:hypothetical protein
MLVYVPISIWSIFNAKVAVLVASISVLPVHADHQLAIAVGLYEFTSVHRLRAWWMSLPRPAACLP